MSDQRTNIIEYLYSLNSLGIKPGLERIKKLCTLLCDPQNKIPSIIIGGTNGKGSTVAFLSSIMREAGHRVASYTSPHIHAFNERISINGDLISDEDVARISIKIKSLMDGYNSDKREEEKLHPTFFEFTTALAFEYFREKEPDIAILEVGLGGIYDAVNIADPILSVISSVSIDHIDFMGNSIEAIAREKGGIIKPQRITITSESSGIPFEVFEVQAKENKAILLSLSKDFFFEKKSDNVFDYWTTLQDLPDIRVSLTGDHQFINASLALCSALILKENYEYKLTIEAIYDGLKKAYIAGRMEEIKTTLPFRIILDGAHNHGAAKVIANETGKRFKKEELTVMLGIMGNKEYEKITHEFASVADRLILVRPEMERSWSLEAMKSVANKTPEKFRIIPNIASAIDQLKGELAEKDTLLITGSIFTVAEASAVLKKKYP